MKQTKIVCTLGPASNTVTVMRQLIRAGMNVGRLNFSHGDHESHRQTIRNLREAWNMPPSVSCWIPRARRSGWANSRTAVWNSGTAMSLS